MLMGISLEIVPRSQQLDASTVVSKVTTRRSAQRSQQVSLGHAFAVGKKDTLELIVLSNQSSNARSVKKKVRFSRVRGWCSALTSEQVT